MGNENKDKEAAPELTDGIAAGEISKNNIIKKSLLSYIERELEMDIKGN
jgi:hypothetical protein